MSFLYKQIELVAPISYSEACAMLEVMRPAFFIKNRGNWFREIRIDGNGFNADSTVLTCEPDLIGPEFTCAGLGFAHIPSFHRYAAAICFKPSLAEVLGSIKRYCRDWSTVRYFALRTEGLSSSNCIGSTWHWSECILITDPLVLGKRNELGGHWLEPMPTVAVRCPRCKRGWLDCHRNHSWSEHSHIYRDQFCAKCLTTGDDAVDP